MISAANCDGCRNDFYNGKNLLGIKECWSLKTATLVPRLLIHVDQPPPYLNVKPRKVPSCFKMPRFVTVKPDSLDAKGFWR